ncbi:penicillin-binding protein 2 [Photobacterium iliopiscarium]|uniref:penicillin-binding protein 2 n=1 Tax=Photobacterium iliopiscarium TaxID=56192 RepID=UPI000D172708|nr:penicillin-binding protein 2 [Photobacterium iliopiscarium]PST99709.1 penicillin-binding protein 2 [Photobacterium iliopiscarium]PSV83047.1 penicillin-binding protein 2 [Photobacterium iliopiscarium]
MKKKYSRQIRDHKQEKDLFIRRAIQAFIGILILTCVLIANLYHLQVQDYSEYKARSHNNSIKLIAVAPNRGRIYDRNGVILADNIPVCSLEIIPYQVKNLPQVLLQLQSLLGISDKEIAAFNKAKSQLAAFKPVTLIAQMNNKQVAVFSVNEFQYPGVNVDAHLERYYPYGAALTHLLGYVGKINDRDIAALKKSGEYENYKATRTIGKLGIEHYYENLLHGKTGYETVEVNSHGRVVRTVSYVPPVAGKDLKLTIDINLQLYSQKLLTLQQQDPITGLIVTKVRRGAIVAMNPKNGAILAMVSSPSYNPNLFVNGISSKAYAALLNDPARPLINRATLGLYPPGSTVKPELAAAGLTTGVITVHTVRNNHGWWRIPNSKSRKFRDDRKQGFANVDIYKAIEKSVNTYFYQVAYDLGIDRLSMWMTKFGYGQHSGIDIDEDSTGIMPTRAWKMARFHHQWMQGDTVPLGIGQGYWTATPIQIAKATSVIAEDGIEHRPHLLKDIIDGKVQQPVTFADFKPLTSVPQKDWAIIKKGMELVVEKGTASRMFQNMPFQVAGKTGTSQVYSMKDTEHYNSNEVAEHFKDHALFTGFAPANDPTILVTVVLEHGGWGWHAAPFARDIMEYVLLKPTLHPQSDELVQQPSPSLAGLHSPQTKKP